MKLDEIKLTLSNDNSNDNVQQFLDAVHEAVWLR